MLASYLLAVDQVASETNRTSASFADPVQLGFDVTPQEAIDYFKNKRVVTRKQFDLLADDARSAAFTVSGVYKEEVLEGFKSEITKALEEGFSQSTVIKRIKDIVSGANKSKQLGNYHLETVVRTNLAMANGVGRRRALEDVADDLPFWQYHAVMDDRVRPTHAALNGLILPANHEFWNSHFPPFDFNCRCTVTALDGIPNGYNKTNPSGEAEIFYDTKDMPVKAEIDSKTYDLTVSGFNSILPNPNLRSMIESVVKRSKE